MKKVLSILLSMFMLAGCFVAMVPSANAAVKNPERFPVAYKDQIIYKEDFEGEDVVAAADATALLTALGWKDNTLSKVEIREDVPDTEEPLEPVEPVNEGAPAETNHRLFIQPGSDTTVTICEDDRLIGGGYIVEYTAIMLTFAETTDGAGMGFRSSYKEQEAGWNFLTKERGNFDFHFHTATNGAGNHHSEEDIAKGEVTINDVKRSNGSIVGQEIRFRLVIDAKNGLSAYTVDLETGEATIVVAMDADYVSAWAKSAHTLGNVLKMRAINASTSYLIDDIAVYTLDTQNYDVPMAFAYQTTAITAEGGALNDTYDIRFLAKLAKKTDAHSLGYKVEYRYEDEATNTVRRGSKLYTCNYVYSQVSASYGEEAISFEDFQVVAIHIEDIPTTHDIIFTVTPFATYWSDWGCEEFYEFGTPVSYSVTIPR